MLALHQRQAFIASLREDYLSQVQRVFLSRALTQHPQRKWAALLRFYGFGKGAVDFKSSPYLGAGKTEDTTRMRLYPCFPAY